MAEPGPGARQLAELFHDRYEQLAPQFGYETRKETRTFDPTTANGRLMIAVCDEILNWFDLRVTADELVRLRAALEQIAKPSVTGLVRSTGDLECIARQALSNAHETPVLRTCTDGIHEFDENTWFCKHCGERQAPL